MHGYAPKLPGERRGTRQDTRQDASGGLELLASQSQAINVVSVSWQL